MGRIAKWGTVLGAFDIKYMPCTSAKGQVLADLVAEFTEPALEEISTTQNMDGKSVAQSPCKNLPSGRYMLMVRQIKGALEWG